MKFIHLLLLLLFLVSAKSFSQEVNQNTVELARVFSKDIFESNGIPFSQPLVETVNATSNSGFFNTSYIPKKDSLYFKFSVNTMLGFIPESKMLYSPSFPSQEFNIFEALSYGQIQGDNFLITDSVGLYTYLLRTLIHDGIEDGSIQFPERSATIFGSTNEKIKIEDGSLANNAEKRISTLEAKTGAELSEEVKQEILNTLDAMPGFFSLPKGANMSSLLFAIPQLEIGSYMGTEVLLRFIPKLDYGNTIGNFGFFGIGLKHSLTQYFYDDRFRPFDMALQVAYQNTSLDNTIGETGAELNSNADILNVNLNFSKSIEDWFDIFSGLSFESINIESRFRYYLPVEVQAQLGLLPVIRDPDEGFITEILPPNEDFPGDTNPQSTSLNLNDFNIKWLIGLKKDIGPMTVFISYNISRIDLLNAGIQYNF